MKLIEEAMRVLGCASHAELSRKLGRDRTAVAKWMEKGQIPERAEKELRALMESGTNKKADHTPLEEAIIGKVLQMSELEQANWLARIIAAESEKDKQ